MWSVGAAGSLTLALNALRGCSGTACLRRLFVMRGMQQTDLAPYLDQNSQLNLDGVDLLIRLLEKLPREQWGAAFVPLKKMGVHVAADVLIVKDGKALLTWRSDPYFTGWHVPGSYLFQGEDWRNVALRCARNELGIAVELIRLLAVFNHPDSSRFHDVSVLLLCRPCTDPTKSERIRWFGECPPDIIPVHKKLWPTIADCLLKNNHDGKDPQ